MRIVQLMTDRSRYFNPSKNYWFSFNAFRLWWCLPHNEKILNPIGNYIYFFISFVRIYSWFLIMIKVFPAIFVYDYRSSTIDVATLKSSLELNNGLNTTRQEKSLLLLWWYVKTIYLFFDVWDDNIFH